MKRDKMFKEAVGILFINTLAFIFFLIARTGIKDRSEKVNAAGNCLKDFQPKCDENVDR
jgi:hypothetical protein